MTNTSGVPLVTVHPHGLGGVGSAAVFTLGCVMNPSRSHHLPLLLPATSRSHNHHCTLLWYLKVSWTQVAHLGTPAVHLWQITVPWLEVLLAQQMLRNSQRGGHREDGEKGKTPQRGQDSCTWWSSLSGGARNGMGGSQALWEAAKAGSAWGDRNEGHEACKDYGKEAYAEGWHRTPSWSTLSQARQWLTLRQVMTHASSSTHGQGENWAIDATLCQCGTLGSLEASPCHILTPTGSTGWEAPTPWCNLALFLQGCFYSWSKEKKLNVRAMNKCWFSCGAVIGIYSLAR